MKLIYALNGVLGLEEIGILRDFDFDLAYGEDENNFTLTIPLNNHCIQPDWFVYIIDESSGAEEGTEYGGIVDAIQVDTERNEIMYSGRTWHGILDGRVIEPDENSNVITVSGDAHDIMRQIITPSGDLDGIITVSNEIAPVSIGSYTFPKYVHMYKGLNDMLATYGCKIKFQLNPAINKLVVSAVWAVAFNQEDDMSDSEVDFVAQSVTNTVNHIICTGRDDDENVYTIHLYANENGGVMPYSTVSNPVQDSDYILDDTNQVVTGINERCEVYNANKVSITKNYVQLSTQPTDWSENFEGYFEINPDNGKFIKIKFETQDTYSLLGTQPEDWTTNYGKYYTANHKAVQGIDTSTYERVQKKPKDWNFNYSNYYKRTWDGTQYVYTVVSSVQDDRYEYQTAKPSDWEERYSSYYQKKIVKTQKSNSKTKTIETKTKGDGYEAVKKVKQGGSEVVPTWKKNTYFTKYTSSKVPAFKSTDYICIKNKSSAAPTFATNTYYFKTKEPIAPTFKADFYYEQVLDHYADMVEEGLERLKEYQFRDTIDIDLNLYGEFDVGDTIEVVEHTTGIAVWQPIVKKIVSINRKGKTIDYRVGNIEIG